MSILSRRTKLTWISCLGTNWSSGPSMQIANTSRPASTALPEPRWNSRGWLPKWLTHSVTGLEHDQEMMQTLTTERGAIKVFVNVAND